jgi:hypothetical protein
MVIKMAFSQTGYKSFRLRQLTGIPLSKICEVACDIAYEVLRSDPELRERIIKENSICSPVRQLELDLQNGYEKVIDDG